MSKAPPDPKRGWIEEHALKWGSVDEYAIRDDAVLGCKIPAGAIDVSKFDIPLRELIEQLPSILQRLNDLEQIKALPANDMYPVSTDASDTVIDSAMIQLSKKRSRPRKQRESNG